MSGNYSAAQDYINRYLRGDKAMLAQDILYALTGTGPAVDTAKYGVSYKEYQKIYSNIIKNLNK